MPPSRLIHSLVLLAGISGFCHAGNPAGADLQRSVSALGELNGVMLACRQMALSARLREILINEAPKERAIGELYEQATQTSFLAQGQEGKLCPDSKSLVNQVDTAREALRRSLAIKP